MCLSCCLVEFSRNPHRPLVIWPVLTTETLRQAPATHLARLLGYLLPRLVVPVAHLVKLAARTGMIDRTPIALAPPHNPAHVRDLLTRLIALVADTDPVHDLTRRAPVPGPYHQRAADEEGVDRVDPTMSETVTEVKAEEVTKATVVTAATAAVGAPIGIAVK